MKEAASTVRVRPARLEDSEALADLATQLGYPSKKEEIAERLRQILPDPDHAVLVAELPASGACGFAHVFAGISLETGARAELLGLVTDGKLRSRGLGRRLVAEAERWAREKGLGALCVHCNVVRTEAHRFYETLGYECAKTQKYFRKRLAAKGESEAK